MRHGVMIVAGCAAGLLGAGFAALAPAQDAPAPKAQVVVEDNTGTTHQLVQGRLFAETVGILSVSLEPSDTFNFTIGAGTVKVPVADIRRLEFAGEQAGAWTRVTLTHVDGSTVAGVPDNPAKAEIRGHVAGAPYAEVTLRLDRVRTIQFTRAPGTRACPKCQRPWTEREWRYCPLDGQRLPKTD